MPKRVFRDEFVVFFLFYIKFAISGAETNHICLCICITLIILRLINIVKKINLHYYQNKTHAYSTTYITQIEKVTTFYFSNLI